MAKSIEVDINVNNNVEGSIAQLKALKRELKNTAVGTEEFKKLYNQIDDLEDKIKSAKNVSSDWIDSLESAGGPLGMVGAALNKAKVATQSFGSALKATGIGLIVAAVGGLVAAFSESESAIKKLEPLFIGLEKILGGIMKVFEPLLDMFIELALKALPYITKGIGGFYSGIFALFTLLKNVGIGAGNILKGIFTLDFDSIKEGYAQLTGSWGAAVKDFEATNKRFAEGTNEQTKTEKKNSVARIAIRKTEKKEKDAIVDSELLAMREFQGEYEAYLKRLADLQAQYNTEIEDLEADTEQKKLDLWYKRRAEEIEAITKDAGEKNDLYALLEMQRAIKQKEIDAKIKEQNDKNKTQRKEDLDKEEAENQRTLDAKLQAQLQYASAVGGVIGALGGLFEQGSDAAKAAALTEIAINTALGFVQGLDIAQKSAKATGPAAAFAFPIFYATQIGAVLSAASKARAILTSGSGSAGGGGGAVPTSAAPQAPSFNVVGTAGANANQIANLSQSQAPLKAYVVSQDVTTQQALDRNIIKTSSLG